MSDSKKPSSSSPRDPRVYFAAERTLLAWIRTSLGLMGMGFVVARFALFLQTVSVELHTVHPRGLSRVLGIGLVIVGSITILVAALQHQRFVATLSDAERPQHYWPAYATLLAYTIAAAGGGLAVLLAS